MGVDAEETLVSQDAIAQLRAAPRPMSEANDYVPDAPGLYAVYGDADIWSQLGLGDPPDSRPLYVGKAEDSMIKRDLRTHFISGRTGSSTLRRSFAGLLRDRLALEPQPRNPDRPERPANYGLAMDGDERLTQWMRSSLSIACWVKPAEVNLERLEVLVLAEFIPPLNLKDVETPWRSTVKSARAVMAAECRLRIEADGGTA